MSIKQKTALMAASLVVAGVFAYLLRDSRVLTDEQVCARFKADKEAYAGCFYDQEQVRETEAEIKRAEPLFKEALRPKR